MLWSIDTKIWLICIFQKIVFVFFISFKMKDKWHIPSNIIAVFSVFTHSCFPILVLDLAELDELD